jgi:D-alanine transaminase
MLYQEATEKGAGECILVRNGMVTEATHSTVFGVAGGTVITHPLSNLILPGITRRVVLELCAANGIPVVEEPIPSEKLKDLDELFIAGTGSEIMPVVQIDEKHVGDSTPGPVTLQLQHLFFEYVHSSGLV